MLINAKAIKSRIKEAGLRSNKEIIVTIDKKVDELITGIINKAKEKKLKTLTILDIL